MYIVYKITCLTNGKMYIGQTSKSIEERYRDHKNVAKYGMHHNNLFYNAIKKHGEENFTVEQIDEAETLEEVLEKEMFWIAYYKSNHYRFPGGGYNSTDGGEGAIGFRMPESAKQKLREANLGKRQSQETIEKRRIFLIGNKHGLGHKHSEEARKRMSEARKGKKRPNLHTEESRKRISEFFKGRPSWRKGYKRPKEESLQITFNNIPNRLRKFLEKDFLREVLTAIDWNRIELLMNDSLFLEVVVFVIEKLNELKPSEIDPEMLTVRNSVKGSAKTIKQSILKLMNEGYTFAPNKGVI